MPKYTLSPQKQQAILRMQQEYTHDIKLHKRMRQNQMLARGTTNFFRSVRNVYTRHVLMKRPDRVQIRRDYLLPLYKQHQTYDLFAALTDNPQFGVQPSSWSMLFMAIGFLFGYFMCRVNNDINGTQYFCYVRFPHHMAMLDQMKGWKWSENSARSVLDEMYYRTDFEKGELKTRSGYFRMKERVKEDLFHTKEKQAQAEQKQKELEEDTHEKDSQMAELEQFMLIQEQKLKNTVLTPL